MAPLSSRAAKPQAVQDRLGRLRQPAVERSPRATGLSSLEETVLELQRTIGNAGVTALVEGKAPVVQRTIGWPGAKTKNVAKDTIESVDRYPIYGLSVGNQEPNTKKNRDPDKDASWMDNYAYEKCDKRAIVLIPHGLKPTSKPDVLFELHGPYIGWREGKKTKAGAGAIEGDTRDQSDEAIVQSLPQNMIAVLPQGTATSNFGSIDPATYVPEALKMIEGWEGAETGRLLYSAHSGGGGTLDPGLGPGLGGKPNAAWKARRAKRQTAREAKRPGGLREIALFDAINGTNELASVRGWLWDSVNGDIDNLKGQSREKQKEYLKTVVVFRGYWEKTGDYPALYTNLQKLRDELLERKAPHKIPDDIWAELGTHYLIFGPLPMQHHEMVQQNLPDAIKAMDLAGKNTVDRPRKK
jgi:hypothetical protein